VDVVTDTLAAGNLLVLSLADVSLFVGHGATLSGTTIDATVATGLLVDHAHLSLAVLTSDATGDARSWLALSGGFASAGLVGIGQDVTFTGKGPSFRATLASGLSGSTAAQRIGWTQGGAGLTGVAALDAITATDILSASGSVELNVGGFVLATGGFTLSKTAVSDLALSDSQTVVTGELLTVSVTSASVFAGAGATLAGGKIVKPGATGVEATGASLDLAVLRSTAVGDTARWTALSGTLTSAGPVGLPDAVVLKVKNAKVVTNAATGLLDGSAATKTDWTVGGTGLTGIASLDAL